MCTCQIEWIDSVGTPTPDTNAAIGVVYCRWVRPEGISFSPAFAICAAHAAKRPVGLSSCYLGGRVVTSEWVMLETAGDMLAEATIHESQDRRAIAASLRLQAQAFAATR